MGGTKTGMLVQNIAEALLLTARAENDMTPYAELAITPPQAK